MKFSIIIPCYNTAQYLANCLESIMKQTYTDWEMILINDGSTDNTEDIMCSYANKDNRIKVFSQPNKGLSAARNNGISKAIGDYLLFLDSDDSYKNENSLEYISQASYNGSVDIVTFQYEKVTPDGKHILGKNNLQYFNDINVTYTGSEFLQSVLDRNEMYQWYSVLYALKRKFWIENELVFSEGIRYMEDADLIYKVLLKSQRISVLKEPIYQYRIGRDGQLTQISKPLLQSRIYVCENNIDTVNSMEINSRLKTLLNNSFSFLYFSVIGSVNNLNKRERKDIFYLLYKKKYLMSYTIRKRQILIRKMVYILGFHIVARVLYIRRQYDF